jgi:sporulation protein YlmC with PRC-barrel domain
MTPRLLSSSSITGTNVKNAEAKDIGEIKDLMIDWDRGAVEYAVLSFGGFLGMGDKLFAIPLEAFEFNTEDKEGRIVLNVDKERLKDAPGFDKDNWPSHADQEFTNSVYSYYGVDRGQYA